MNIFRKDCAIGAARLPTLRTGAKRWGRPATLMISAAVAATSLHALEWQKKAIAVDLPAGTPEVAVQYPFTNNTGKPVHIIEITTSCHCTVAAARSTDVAPGAQGVIDAVFTAGDHHGRQNKIIYVRTDESPQPFELRLEVTIGSPQANERK